MTEQPNSIQSLIDQMLKAVSADSSLERELRMAITAKHVCLVAEKAGVKINPADLVKHYALSLLNSTGETSVHNFDLCSWDIGELSYAMQNWKHE